MINYGALAGRPHGGRPTVPILLSEADRAAIAAAMRPAEAEQRVVRRAQALLMMADGVPGMEIAACRLPSDVGLPVTHWSASLLGEHVRSEGIQQFRRSPLRSARDRR